MYYQGQEGAAATAAILFGDCDPGGRLTESFAVDDAHHPVAGDPHRYPGVNGAEVLRRGSTSATAGTTPPGTRALFPFGHGLSYTSFAYEDLQSGGEVTFAIAQHRAAPRCRGGAGLPGAVARSPG